MRRWRAIEILILAALLAGPTGLIVGAPLPSNVPNGVGPPSTFRTDGSAAEVVASGAHVLASYDSFVVANGPATAIANLAAIGRYVQPMPFASTLHLLGGDFDVHGLARAQMARTAVDSSGDAISVIHFVGPISASWVSALRRNGLEVLAYIPEDGLAVRGPPAAVSGLSLLPYIDWQGPYEPSWKVRPGLATSGLVDVRIVVFPGESPLTVEAWLAHRGVGLTTATNQLGAGLMGAFGSSGFQWVRARVDTNLVPELSSLSEVEFIDPVLTPVPLNAATDWIIQTNRTFANGTGDYRYWRYGLDGAGQVVGIADTGVDYDSPQFRQSPAQITIGDIYNATDGTRRKVVRYLDMGVLTGMLAWPGGAGPWDPYSAADCPWSGSGAGGHGTAVSSTLAGNDFGIVSPPSLNDGNALSAKIYMEDIGGLSSGTTCAGGESLMYLPEDYQNLFGPAGLVYNDPVAPVRIQSDSWGATSNAYDVQAREVDAFVWSHPDMTIFFAAGNGGPAAGTIDTPGTAKNIMAVGGAYNPDGAAVSGFGQNDLASFGSRGPTADGRIKPDILSIANGFSASSSGDPRDNLVNLADHGWAGTSYSTPAAAAAAAIVRQYFVDGWYPSATPIPADGFAPSAALIRAMLLASGVQITGSGTFDTTWPNNGQGFGRILLSSVLPIASAGDAFRTQVVDETAGLLTGQSTSYSFRVLPGAPQAKFVLTWTDYPGTLGATKALVNDLDLEVTAPNGTVYRGNHFGSFAQGVSVPGGSFDSTNVEEAVILKHPATGEWTVKVIGANVPVGPQPFALVATGGLDTAYGRVILDRAVYRENATVGITVEDSDASAVQVRVASDLEPAGELVTLAQAAPGAPWRGSVPLAFGQPAPDGIVEVRDGDTISVAYQDASPVHTALATAKIVGTGAAIARVRAESIGSMSAAIRWTTDLASSSEVRYGLSSSALTQRTTEGNLTFDHEVVLPNLQADTSYDYEVLARDQVGHVTTDTNGGRYYSFRTSPYGDVLLVIGDPTFPGSRLRSYETALDAFGWSWSLWNVSARGLPPLPFLQARKAVLWQVGLEQYPTFNNTARTLVKAYLDGGGRLFVSSHDTSWALGSSASPWQTTATRDWLAGTLKVSFACDPTTTPQMDGQTGDPISGSYAGGIPYAPHRDGGADDEVVALSLGGTTSVMWTDSNSVVGCSPPNQPVGVRWVSSAPNGTVGSGVWGGTPSRLAYFAFEITSVDTNGTDLRPGSALRAQILDNVLRWLVGISANALDRDHPKVVLTSPLGGVFSGPTLQVMWNATAYGPGLKIGSVSLDASPDGGQSWSNLAVLAGNATAYAWNISGEPNADTYRLRVTALDNGVPPLSGQDTSNISFSIHRPGGDVLGPVIEAGSLRLAPDPPGSTFPVWINATADDARSGNGTITSAEMFLSPTRPSAANGSGIPMPAADGRFDSPIEPLAWNGALAAPPGPTCAWVHARDLDGNWGPFNATCFPALSLGPDVTPPAPADLSSISLANGGADLSVKWNRAWDDSLYGGTARYRVLRAPAAAGPYAPIGADVLATQSLSYAFVDPARGAGDSADYFYRIETFDAANNSMFTPALLAKVWRTLSLGQNLLGLPVDPPSEVLAGLAFEVPWTAAWAYDGCAGPFGWQRATPGIAASSVARIGQGLWVNASAAGRAILLGITPAIATMTLCRGWNLIGLPGFLTSLTVANLRAVTGATSVQGFDSTDPYHTRPLADAEPLVPGSGYWVYVPANVTWTAPGW